jgi:hypothetical protein
MPVRSLRLPAAGTATLDSGAAFGVPQRLVYQDDDVLNGGSVVAVTATGVPVTSPFSGGVTLDFSPDRPLAHDALFSALESDAIHFGDLELGGDGLLPGLEAGELQHDAEDADG